MKLTNKNDSDLIKCKTHFSQYMLRLVGFENDVRLILLTEPALACSVFSYDKWQLLVHIQRSKWAYYIIINPQGYSCNKLNTS